MYYFSKNSLEKFKGVHPNLVAFMKELIKVSPHDFSIAEGVRTAEYQNSLYQKGRTIFTKVINGKTIKLLKVTGADGYRYKSNHQVKCDGYGYAVDIGVLVKENGKMVYKGKFEDAHYYIEIYKVAKEKGLLEKYGIEWGGNCWKSFQDNPHWQIKGADNVRFK